MSKCTIVLTSVLIIASLVCESFCDETSSDIAGSVAPVFGTRVAAPKDDIKNFKSKFDELNGQYDEMLLEWAKKSPDFTLSVVDPQVEKLEKELADLPLSEKMGGFFSSGKSKQDKLRQDLGRAYLQRTVALQEIGKLIESLVELKKTEQMLRKTKSEALKILPKIESSIMQRIKDTLHDNPKALFGFEDLRLRPSELLDRYTKLYNNIKSLKMPRDATLSSAVEILHKAYSHLIKNC